MIGKSLQSWFKEFATLVFTQSIQAFIYAVIISIVTFSMTKTSGVSAEDQNGALGLLSVVALASVFKVEEMLRKILGLGTSQASVKGAMGSIANTAIALKMGQKVLNNAGKSIKGGAQWTKGKMDLKKEDKRFATAASENKAVGIRADDTKDQKEKELDINTEQRKTAIEDKYKNKKDVIEDKYKKKKDEVLQATKNKNETIDKSLASDADKNNAKAEERRKAIIAAKELDTQKAAELAREDLDTKKAAELAREDDKKKVLGDQISTRHQETKAAVQQKYKTLIEDNKSKVSDIQKTRREGVKMMASGVTETVGATIGGTMGGIIGGADGNIGEALKGIMKGAGTGDMVGQGVVSVASSGVESANRLKEYSQNFLEDVRTAETDDIKSTTSKHIARRDALKKITKERFQDNQSGRHLQNMKNTRIQIEKDSDEIKNAYKDTNSMPY